MKTKVSLIMMSHLSDLQVHTAWHHGNFDPKNRHRINFIKYLVLNYPNTEIEIDSDTVYSEFKTKHPNL